MSMVTIVMSAYNGEKYIREQIDSLLASTYQDFEILITDDMSKDSTVNILKEYEAKHPDKIHVFQNEKNMGYILNFLTGICRTTSEYIMLCDQDDVWKPDKIEKTLNRLKKIEEKYGKTVPNAVFSDAVVVDQNLNTINQSFFESGHLKPLNTDLSHILMENKLIGCTVMINAALRKILQEHDLPQKAKLHDWWIALIAATFGNISFINEGLLLYRQHGSNAVGDTGFAAYFKTRITSLRKQKESLLVLQNQAGEFLKLYGSMMSDDKKIIIQRFARLNQMNCINRRIVIMREGYLKSGIVRNFGLMLIV